ncbi:MAG: hypothetical protein PXY39_11165 [archaeon]|nr:hypothetical protein [archaeon]
MESPNSSMIRRQFKYLSRFYSHLGTLSPEALESSRKARGTKERFTPYQRMLVSRISSQDIRIFYAPFDFVNVLARVVILGISPDYNTMFRAYSLALKTRPNACDRHLRLRSIAVEVARKSLYHDERSDLVKMMDGIGLNNALGIKSCSEMFDTYPEILHMTSVMRYPTFKGAITYIGFGHKPELLSYERFREDFVNVRLASELRSTSEALIIPLGDIASEVLLHLIRRNVLDYRRCMLGFPNASRISAERWSLYEKRKKFLGNKVRLWASLHHVSKSAKQYRAESKAEHFFRVSRIQKSLAPKFDISYVRKNEKGIWKAVQEIPRNLAIPRTKGIYITHLLLTSFYQSGPKYLQRKLEREGVVLSPKATSIVDLLATSQQSVSWDRVVEWSKVRGKEFEGLSPTSVLYSASKFRSCLIERK